MCKTVWEKPASSALGHPSISPCPASSFPSWSLLWIGNSCIRSLQEGGPVMEKVAPACHFCCEGVSRYEGTARPCLLVLNLEEVKSLADAQAATQLLQVYVLCQFYPVIGTQRYGFQLTFPCLAVQEKNDFTSYSEVKTTDLHIQLVYLWDRLLSSPLQKNLSTLAPIYRKCCKSSRIPGTNSPCVVSACI